MNDPLKPLFIVINHNAHVFSMSIYYLLFLLEHKYPVDLIWDNGSVSAHLLAQLAQTHFDVLIAVLLVLVNI